MAVLDDAPPLQPTLGVGSPCGGVVLEPRSTESSAYQKHFGGAHSLSPMIPARTWRI